MIYNNLPDIYQTSEIKKQILQHNEHSAGGILKQLQSVMTFLGRCRIETRLSSDERFPLNSFFNLFYNLLTKLVYYYKVA